MTPKFSLEECLNRYLRQLRVQHHLESTSPPVPESRQEWLAELDAQREDIDCVEHWLSRVQSGKAV